MTSIDNNSDGKKCKKCNKLEIPNDSNRKVCFDCISPFVKHEKRRKCEFKCRTCKYADEDDYYYKEGKYSDFEEEKPKKKKAKPKVSKRTETYADNVMLRMQCKKGYQ